MFIVHIANVLSYFNLLWAAAVATPAIDGKHEDAYMQSTMGKNDRGKAAERTRENEWPKRNKT